MALQIQPNRYVKVNLTDASGRYLGLWVHRLVALAFHPVREATGLEVNHLDGDPSNNRAANLEWTTPTGNMVHAEGLGLLNHPVGEAVGNSRLTEAEVVEIRYRAAAGESFRSIGRRFGVVHHTVGLIVRRETWRHI